MIHICLALKDTGYRLVTNGSLCFLQTKRFRVDIRQETIAATLHIGEGTLITPSSGVTGTQHYVKFTSEDTGRSLIIPLAGSKGDKSSSNNPAFGKRAVLWTNERNGLPGGYAWAYWLPFEGAETAVIKKQRLQMEAFASVRCVKK